MISWSADGRFVEYDIDLHHWSAVLTSPAWYQCTQSLSMSCAHPDGVLVAGASEDDNDDDGVGRHASFINIRNKEVRELPVLPHGMTSGGMMYSDGFVTIAGVSNDDGLHLDSSSSNLVYQLHLDTDTAWRQLPSLPVDVYWSMLQSDADYIYSIGGVGSNQFSRLHKRQNEDWDILAEIPERCDSLRCGTLMINHTLLLISPLSCMTYDVTSGTWSRDPHNDKDLEYASVVMHDGRILVHFLDSDGNRRLEYYNHQEKSWTRLGESRFNFPLVSLCY